MKGVSQLSSKQLNRVLFGIGSAIAMIALWELAVRILRIPEYLLPAPTTIFSELMTRLPRVLENAWYTLTSIVIGFLLGAFFAVPLAVLIAFSRWFEVTVYPTIVFLQIIPKIAIAPLFIIWFGFGEAPKILLVFLLTFFPITVSLVSGLKSCDADLLELARSTGASATRIFFRVRFPSALPELMTGLKVSAALASTAAVVAEFVAADRGLGYLLLTYNGEMNTSMVFATVFVLGILGVGVYYTVEIIERIAIPWHVSARRQGG